MRKVALHCHVGSSVLRVLVLGALKPLVSREVCAFAIVGALTTPLSTIGQNKALVDEKATTNRTKRMGINRAKGVEADYFDNLSFVYIYDVSNSPSSVAIPIFELHAYHQYHNLQTRKPKTNTT